MRQLRKPTLLAVAFAILASAPKLKAAQPPSATFRSNVDMVMLTFSVSDNNGKAVTGLAPSDVRILEDGIPQSIVSFTEGSKLVSPAVNGGGGGNSIYVLFNTSNRMYMTFPYVYDAIADFLRRLDPADSVALYTFSRNLSRAAPLTSDHQLARAGLQRAVAGDDTALFNSLLLTLRDAGKVAGRKTIVVFSNGPDNRSMVSPDDVGRVAEDYGIPIYIISTPEPNEDQVTTHALESLVQRTGGKLYWVGEWQKHGVAFESVRRDIASSYTACYYPKPNGSEGFRSIRVEIVSSGAKNWRVHARAGYRKRHAERASGGE